MVEQPADELSSSAAGAPSRFERIAGAAVAGFFWNWKLAVHVAMLDSDDDAQQYVYKLSGLADVSR